MSNKEIWNLAKGIERSLWHYREICYSDESNSRFDELHDDLLYQCEGYEETMLELRDEIEDDELDAEGWLKSLKGELEMVEQIEKYYELTQGIVEADINWIYA